ncbi:MAG: methyltransferase domain-containing protein [Anaerolineales bacterium]|nr:methyltransferase domain-containing protein [Anaerolineales bacterium]
MNCYYCDKIEEVDPGYPSTPAFYDLGSAAPRCPRHWRYLCGKCGEPSHFMRTSFCTEAEEFFCSACATELEEVADSFWAWKYYYRYLSPWSDRWSPALDRLEFEGRHPIQNKATHSKAQAAISQEEYLVRYPARPVQWRPKGDFTDEEIQSNWNANADRWVAQYNDDGDPNRRYQSDQPMLALLGDVQGKCILDVGCGNGYLCRKLSRQGAIMTGVDLSDRFIQIAQEREAEEKLGITYHVGSVAEMNYLPNSHFDKAVSNYVLMDVRDYVDTLFEVRRVLKNDGTFVVVISHPCFTSGPGGWATPAPDSPRAEDGFGYLVGSYFYSGPVLAQWGNFDPVMSYHRTLRDYWQAFSEVGFTVEAFEEPSITERGRRELPISRVMKSLRIPYSCMFQLKKEVRGNS